METGDKINLSNFLIKEFEKLKDEQRTRIDFRDRMIFITLGAIGAIFSFVIEKLDYFNLLLILPVVCIILGWTYFINDEKISSLGRYFRTEFIERFKQINELPDLFLCTWEDFQRKDKKRRSRKRIQLIIDLSIFCVTSLCSIAFYFLSSEENSKLIIIVSVCEIILILMLAYQFIRYYSLSEK